eukprot:scaffold73160_cov30-Tisochrysis_lutea.AAC.1
MSRLTRHPRHPRLQETAHACSIELSVSAAVAASDVDSSTAALSIIPAMLARRSLCAALRARVRLATARVTTHAQRSWRHGAHSTEQSVKKTGASRRRRSIRPTDRDTAAAQFI